MIREQIKELSAELKIRSFAHLIVFEQRKIHGVLVSGPQNVASFGSLCSQSRSGKYREGNEPMRIGSIEAAGQRIAVQVRSLTVKGIADLGPIPAITKHRERLPTGESVDPVSLPPPYDAI